MDRVFSTLVTRAVCDLVSAAVMCATTPAREVGLVGHGVIAAGAVADLVVLDSNLRVVQTWIGGGSRRTRRWALEHWHWRSLRRRPPSPSVGTCRAELRA